MREGWYVDPSGGFEHRYWDGEQWTEHVASQGFSAINVPAGTWPPPSGVPTDASTGASHGSHKSDLLPLSEIVTDSARSARAESGEVRSTGSGSLAGIIRPFVGQRIGINWAVPDQFSLAQLTEVTETYFLAEALTDPMRGSELRTMDRPRLLYPFSAVLSACLTSQVIKNPHVFGKNPSVAMSVVVQHPPTPPGSGLMVGAIF